MAEETNEPLNDKDRMSYSYRENSLYLFISFTFFKKN